MRIVRHLSCSFALLLGVGVAGEVQAQLPLTNVADIRSLPREIANEQLPVKVRGVVSFAWLNSGRDFVISDPNKAIYVNVAKARNAGILDKNFTATNVLKRGMQLEVEGVTSPGDFAPVIVPRKILILGEGTPQPATRVTLPQLLTGLFDCQQVSLEGVVQRVGNFNPNLPTNTVEFLVATEGGGHFTAVALDSMGLQSEGLAGALVCIRGCALPLYNHRGELLGVRVMMSDPSDLDVLRRPPTDPFAIPLASLEHLKFFSTEPPNMQRRRIQGVVTLCRKGEFFYLQSGNRAVRVTTTQLGGLAVGDQVEAVGFVEIAQHFAELHEAVFRKIGTTNPPVPVAVNWDRAIQLSAPFHELEAFDMDGRLISLEGRLENVEAIPGESVRLYLKHEGHTILASFGKEVPPVAMENLRIGSDLVVTGVCLISLSMAWPALNEAFPTGFQILLRSPDDVFVLRAAPWWTPRRLLAALVIGSAVLGAMILWAWQLRRQLNRKTHELATEMHKRRDAAIEFEATLRERNRLAGNLHDTLLQSISALNYQLEACEVESVPPAERKVNYLQSARRIVQRAQQDLRGTVWALRVLPLHDRTFAEALQTLANQLTEGRDVKIIVETDHALPLLSEFVAGNLLLVAQEAMHNALKHAHPTRIEAVISGAANGGTVTIDIRDNGTGFNLNSTSHQNPGHFGLAGMRERIERLGGKLKIESQPGKGTQVHVEVPVREFDDELASQ